MDGEDEEGYQAKWVRATSGLFESLPDDYSQRSERVRQIHHAFCTRAAKALEGPLNARIQDMPQQSYEDKHALASWLNHELRSLGLAIRCPKTARPAIIVVDNQDARHPGTRFRLQVRDERGRRIKTNTTAHIVSLELMEDNPRQEGASRWEDRADIYKGPRQPRRE